MLEVVHSSDWHWEADKIGKCLASANFIISKCREFQPALHVISGDWWNRRQTLNDSSAVLPALEAIKSLADISPVAMILGNAEHDNPGSYEIFKDLDTKYPIHVADRAGSVWLTSSDLFVPEKPTVPAALVHLFPFPTKSWFLAGRENLSIDESNRAIQEALRGIFAGMGAVSVGADCPAIFIGHCNVQGATLSSGQVLLGQDIMISKHDLELVGAQYYALGHIHKRQAITPVMRYAGSIYHNNFGETEPKSFVVVEFGDDKSVTGAEIDIPSRPLSLHEATIQIDPDEIQVLDERWLDCDWDGAELRVRIHATKEQASAVTDDLVKGHYPGAYSYQIERIIIPEERIRSTEITKARTLREKLTEFARSIEKTVDEETFVLADETEREATQ
jgi:exonuclease SbcD